MRFGLLSYAHVHAPGYASAIANLPETDLVAIYDDNPDRLTEATQRFSLPGYADPADLLARDDIEAVLVMAENAKHRVLVEAAAAAGKHVLCEKPLATTHDDGLAMIDVCERAGGELGVVLPMRYSQAAIHLRDLLRSGEIGEPLAIKATNPGRVPPGWFTNPDLSGGGAVMDHVVHVVDLLRWIFETEVDQVYAEVDTLLNPGLAVDDVGLLMMTLSNGLTASLDSSWSRPQRWPTWGGLTIDVVGERGVAAMDAFNASATLVENSGPRHELLSWGDGSDAALIRGFVSAIERGEPAPISGLDGLRAMDVALCAYQSAAIGAPVQCPR